MTVEEVFLQHMWRPKVLYEILKNTVLEEVVSQQSIASGRPFGYN